MHFSLLGHLSEMIDRKHKFLGYMAQQGDNYYTQHIIGLRSLIGT